MDAELFRADVELAPAGLRALAERLEVGDPWAGLGAGVTGTPGSSTRGAGTDVTGTDVTGTRVTGTDVTGTDVTGTHVASSDGAGLDGSGPDGAPAVLLLGMGSSWYAADTVARRMRAAGIVAVAERASAEPGWRPPPGTLVVAVSASGGSAETVRAAQQYRELSVRDGLGLRLVALTERPDAKLADLADDTVLLGAGPELGEVACRSFRHTLVLLLALADRLTAGPDTGGPDTGAPRARLAAAVRRAAEATEDLLDRRDAWLPELDRLLDGPDGVFVLGPAERLACAEQAALMIREGPRRPAVACEVGDWSHVDVYLTRTLDYRALLLTGSGWQDAALEWLITRGSTVVPVGAPVPGACPALRYRHDGDPVVRLLTDVTVAELLAHRWWTGRQVGAPSR